MKRAWCYLVAFLWWVRDLWLLPPVRCVECRRWCLGRFQLYIASAGGTSTLRYCDTHGRLVVEEWVKAFGGSRDEVEISRTAIPNLEIL